MNFYMGQIGVFGFNFAPRMWAQCNGAILPIAQNTALFSLLGTYYGGNGQSTFGLPNLLSRTPIGHDANYPIGEMGGVEQVTLTNNQMPQHTHNVGAVSGNGLGVQLDGHLFAQGVARGDPNPASAYGTVANTVPLNAQSVSMVNGNNAHSNIQPLLAVNFCIATEGLYPSRN